MTTSKGGKKEKTHSTSATRNMRKGVYEHEVLVVQVENGSGINVCLMGFFYNMRYLWSV